MTAQHTFVETDIVRLRSGGPRMSIVRIEPFMDDVFITAGWFDAQQNYQEKTWPTTALELATQDEG